MQPQHELAAHALSHRSGKKAEKHLKELHVKELHTGGYLVHKHSGKPGEEPTEHGAKDLDEVHDHLETHMGEPNDGEEELEEGEEE